MNATDRGVAAGAAASTFLLTPSTLRAFTSIAVAINRGAGAGFVLSGPRGSGKTHLLMTLRDLSLTKGEMPRWERDKEVPTGPAYRQRRFIEQVFKRHRIAPCYVSPDANTRPFVEVLHESMAEQQPAILPVDADFSGNLDRVDARLLANNYDCLLVMVDDLDSSLAQRSLADAVEDLCLLQEFRERLNGHRVVLVLVAESSLDRGERIPYARLRKIQGRYEPLSLHVDGDLATRYAPGFKNEDLTITGLLTYADRLTAAIEIYRDYASPQSEGEWARAGLDRATDLLTELHELRQRAEQAISACEYARAEELYKELVARDPTNIEVSGGLEKARRIQKLILDSRHRLERNDYRAAYSMLRDAVRLAPSDQKLKRDLEWAWEATLHAFLDRVGRACSRGDLPTASEAYLDLCHLDSWDARSAASARPIRKHATELLRDLARKLAESPAEVDFSRRELRLVTEVAREDPSIAEALPAQHVAWADKPAPSVSHEMAEKRSSAEISEEFGEPARGLADLLLRSLDESALSDYLETKDIVGRTLEARLLELCVAEDPLQILSDLCGFARLRRLAEDLDLDLEPGLGSEELREAILRALDFSIPKKPVGISTYCEVLPRLRGSLRLRSQRADVIGIGLEACDDVAERVLKDLVHFYCTVLMGNEYEQMLREEELLAGDGQSVNRLTFGQKIGLFEGLNRYIKTNNAAKDRMYKWFERGWIVSNRMHLQKNLYLVSPRRNHLARPEGIETATLKREATEALELLQKLFRDFDEGRIYPPVIAVEGIHTDRYGRRTYHCVDDRGYEERVYTRLELQVGQEYFFYPVTNPIRVDPLIVAKG
ncbi:MAG: hypothetical protein ACOC6F_00480 [bacterium]